MARKTKEETAKTREAILESALDLFNENGYSGTTLNDIANRLDLTKGAVYWHFKNKQDLFNTLIDEIEEYYEKKLLKVFFKIKKANDLKIYFMEYATLTLKDNKIRKFMTVLSQKIEWTTEFKELIERFKQMSEEVQNFCAKIIRKSQKKGIILKDFTPEMLAQVVTLMIDGIIFESLSPDTDSDKTLKIVEASLDIFFKGISPLEG